MQLPDWGRVILPGRRRLFRMGMLELRDTPAWHQGWADRQRSWSWQRLFGGGRDGCLMRLIDSGSGIGHRYDAVTNLCPRLYVLARIATHVGPSAERDGGTPGNVDRVRAGYYQGSTARHSDLGLASVWTEETSKRNTCVYVCVSVPLRLARVRSQYCVGIKKKHEMAD